MARHRSRARSDRAEAAEAVGRRAQRGQVLVIFVFASIVLAGAAAIAADASWLFVSQQRMQRAADAAALAGAVFLPGDPTTAYNTAYAEAARNGYVHGQDGIDIQPSTDPGNPRRLIVDIDQPVDTYFARVFCYDGGPCLKTVDVGVQGRAEYVLPVPMGSPQNYYGVGFLVDAVTTTTTGRRTVDTGLQSASGVVSGGAWVNPTRAYDNNNSYAEAWNDGDQQQWRDFGLLSAIPDDPSVTIEGIQVRLTDAFTDSSSTSCRLTVAISWNGGANWSGSQQSGTLDDDTRADYTVGSSGSTSGWGVHSWVRSELSDANFRVRLTWDDGFTGCSSGREVFLDELSVIVHYSEDFTSSTTTIEEVDVLSPEGDVLAPQNFWGAMQSQGAPNIQGDAYMTYYDERTSSTNPDYDPDAYYQYAVEFPAGSSDGEVWIFDPGFCNVDTSKGTGEYWTVGGANGASPQQPVSSYFDLYDARNTVYQTADDVLVASSGDTFERVSMKDSLLYTGSSFSGVPDCRGESWHHGWWKLADGLSGGKTYRLHTHSTDPDSATDQRSTTALNSFAFYSKASGGTPRVYGLGAMEAYVRLPGGLSSEFYLAQIEAEHAGKTMVISLWDPGDTGNLAANLQILRPTATSYEPTDFSYTARQGSTSTGVSSCNARSGTGVSSVTTNTGGSSLYNGCWLTIEIPLPGDYSAPHPSSDNVTNEGGWWKIRYNMSGSTSSNSTDLTTWKVELRGSPVHLVIP